jgi:hypothetical protein
MLTSHVSSLASEGGPQRSRSEHEVVVMSWARRAAYKVVRMIRVGLLHAYSPEYRRPTK